MTTINLREPAEQALKAMRCAVPTGTITLYEWDKAISDLAAALAQQAEPVEPHRWEGDHNIESPFNACMHKSYCMTLKQALAQQSDPQIADRLARHGIPMPGDPK